MKPEEKAEIILWKWLIKSKYIKEVYFNRKNLVNAPTFSVKGNVRKPDFLMRINRGFGDEYVAIEIKSSNKSSNIHDAGKIIDYYLNFYNEKTRYYIDNQEVKINHFVIASENSPKGHLFSNEKEIVSNLDSDDHWRKTNVKYGLEPKKEYSLTNLSVRRLWADFRRIRKEYNIKIGASIGILMANFCENDFSPYLMIMNYNSHLIKPKWGARFWKL
jgi:hypothetical protein